MNINATKIFVWIVVAASLGSIARAADADHGELVGKALVRRLPQSWRADQKQGADNVPSFASVASGPTSARRSWRSFLLDPHPKMPNMALTRRDAEDIAAYIARLGN